MTCVDTIRLATESDVEPLAALYVGSLLDAYAGAVPAAFVNPESVEQRMEKLSNALRAGTHKWILATTGATIVGFCGLRATRDDDLPQDVGEISSFAVDPRHRRHGHGARLLRAARSEAPKLGWDGLVLWVVATNTAARAFYEANGFSPDGESRVDTRLGFAASLLRYRCDVA